ncbi:unnamed protein product [Adineta ricciae]|uniref:Uncharacterized protein n=1 Tax=Adineta ricciae TaxID=249248 RepID=A0A816FD78_ADIRI|nr:unnamed protein product [Adineta ricciae]
MKELKSICKNIVNENQQILNNQGKKLLVNLFEYHRIKCNQIRFGQTSTNLLVDVYMKEFLKDALQKLHLLATDLINKAHQKYDENTQQKHYAEFRGKIRKNIEPSIRSVEFLLEQQFRNDAYVELRENAAIQIQKQLIHSAKQVFDRETRKNTDINDLNDVLNEKHKELRKEFQNSLESLRKSYNEITETILNIYNQIVESRRANANPNDIYNLCPYLNSNGFHEQNKQLEKIFQALHLVSQKTTKKESFWARIFHGTPKEWCHHQEQLRWFSHTYDHEKNQEIYTKIIENLLPQLESNLRRMLLTLKLAYSDPQTIIALIDYVNNSMMGQTSCIQENFQYFNLAIFTRDLIVIALKLLIDEAYKIVDEKHQEFSRALKDLDRWKESILQQFECIRNSYEQGRKFREDLTKQILEQTVKYFKRQILTEIHEKITGNSRIDPEKIACEAYETKNIVDNQIQKLQEKLTQCIHIIVKVIQSHECRNVQIVYQDIVSNLREIVPNFELSDMIGISAEIINPEQFKTSVEQLKNKREELQQEILSYRSEFNQEAIEACKQLIGQRLGCQACCPGCGSKCDNIENGHTDHKSSNHLAMAFKGWRHVNDQTPSLSLCYQQWHKGALIVGKQKFQPKRQFYVDRASNWLVDLEEKSKTGKFCEENVPPPEQCRAWMAVRLALVRHYNMKDYSTYDEKLYPTDIKSVSINFQPTW